MTNEFPFALTDVSIWSGTELLPIGDLGPGETVQIDKMLKTSTLLPRASMYNYYMNPPKVNADDLEKMRKEGMLSFSSEYMNAIRNPVVIGYTDTQIIPVTLENEKPSMSALTMIVQPVNVDIAFNEEFVVEPEMMEMIHFIGRK